MPALTSLVVAAHGSGKSCPAAKLSSARQHADTAGGNVSTAWEEVKHAVAAYKGHSALLGWYV